MPPIQIGPYRLISLLGAGGMGAVYEAIQEPIGRRVALKVLLPQHAQNPDVLTRFFNEARAVNLIEHPSIVQVSDYGQAPDGTAYLVMEYLRGQTLSSRLERLHAHGQRLPVVEAIQIAAQIADALTAAHEKAIVHRDLKPANIMLVRDPAVPAGERAKVLDFGIAKLAQGQAHGTGANVVMGTPQYMSPEQCRGAGGVDDKTDVYALGVMLYEMLAGRAPFVAENHIDYLAQHSFQEPPPLREWAPYAPSELTVLIHTLLIKDKQNRPTMRELGAKLTHWLSSRPAIHSLSPSLGSTSAASFGSALSRQEPLSPPAPSTLGALTGQPQRRRALPKRRLFWIGASLGLAVISILSLAVSLRSAPAPRPVQKAAVQPISTPQAVRADPVAIAPSRSHAEPPVDTSKPPVSAEPKASENRVRADSISPASSKPSAAVKRAWDTKRISKTASSVVQPPAPKKIPIKRID